MTTEKKKIRTRVIEYLEKNPGAKAPEVSAQTGVSPSYCYKVIAELSGGPMPRPKRSPKRPIRAKKVPKGTSDGSTASYYELPKFAKELQHLISHKNMNAQIGEIFRACYRMGEASHSDELRDAKKILFYAKAEVSRLEKNKP
jgi:hypothetical protein